MLVRVCGGEGDGTHTTRALSSVSIAGYDSTILSNIFMWPLTDIHTCAHNYTLVCTATFHLGWWDFAATWTHREAVIRLVRACTSLTCLSLTMNVPVDILLQVAAAAKRSTGE